MLGTTTTTLLCVPSLLVLSIVNSEFICCLAYLGCAYAAGLGT